jgi:hypothetical protein
VGFDLLEGEHSIAVAVGEVEVPEAGIEELLQGVLAIAPPVRGLEIVCGQASDGRQHEIALPVLVEEVEQLDRAAVELLAIDLAVAVSVGLLELLA